MKKIILSCVLISSVFAQTNDLYMDDLLSTLDEVSSIATKTKLNIDQTPSYVTVLHSQKLQTLGVENIYQALRLVPGVALSKESSGVPIVAFRGNTQKGEVQLMVDGVTINNAYRGSTYYYLDFPIELIERIEVIRGPGSVLYGNTAISGVINIITKNSKNVSTKELFVSAGTYDRYKGGAQISTRLNDFHIALDGYYQKSDKDVYVGPDVVGNSGDSDHHLDDYSLGLTLHYDNFSFITRVKKNETGNAYGLFSVLDQDKDKYNNVNESRITELSYKNSLNANNDISISATYNNYKQNIEANHPKLGLSLGDYKESSYFAEAELVSRSFDNNELLLGLKYEYFKVLTSEYIFGDMQINLVDKSSKRKVISSYLNDTYHLSSKIDISAGLRYNNYSDSDNDLNNNLGLVYRYNKNLIFKTAFTHTHRVPFFLELSSNPTLTSEKSSTLEGGVIYKQNVNNTLRLNVYATNLENVIQKDTSGKYVNFGKNKFIGTELEYTLQINKDAEVNLLASYIDAKDDNSDDIVNIANILSSASVIYKFDSGVSLGSFLKYSSPIKQSQTDTREEIDHSIIFDQTISYNFKTFMLSASVKDLFNQGTSYLSPADTYQDNFIDEGRTFLVKASMEF